MARDVEYLLKLARVRPARVLPQCHDWYFNKLETLFGSNGIFGPIYFELCLTLMLKIHSEVESQN